MNSLDVRGKARSVRQRNRRTRCKVYSCRIFTLVSCSRARKNMYVGDFRQICGNHETTNGSRRKPPRTKWHNATSRGLFKGYYCAIVYGESDGDHWLITPKDR